MDNLVIVIIIIIIILLVCWGDQESMLSTKCPSAGIPSFIPPTCNMCCPLIGSVAEKACGKACGCKPIYLDNLEFELRDNKLTSHMRTACNQSYQSIDKCANSRCFSCPEKLPPRPGSAYTLADYSMKEMPAPYRIILLSIPDCSKHRLVMLFNEVADKASEQAGQGLISFERYLEDKTMTSNLGALPAIIKIRRNGEVLRYDKATNFGALYDWVMNEAMLDVSKYP